MRNFNKLRIVSGITNPDLVRSIHQSLGQVEEPIFFLTEPWPNGQPKNLRPPEANLNDKDVFIIQSLGYGLGFSPVEELGYIRANCSEARNIHIILTWFCSKDDNAHHSGHYPTGPAIARKIVDLHPSSITLFDLSKGVTGWFESLVKRRHFYFMKLLIEKAKEIGIDQIAATDISSSGRADKIEQYFNTGHGIILSRKIHDHGQVNSLTKHEFFGEITGQKIGMFDDMGLSLDTITSTARALKDRGAQSIYAFLAHFDPTAGALEKLAKTYDDGIIDQLWVTNSNYFDPRFLQFSATGKFGVVDCGPYLAEIIKTIYVGASTSSLFLDIQ